MNVVYLWSEYQISNRQFELKENQHQWKKEFQSDWNKQKKFCIFRSGNRMTLVVFRLDSGHATVVRGFLSLMQWERSSFVGAGFITPDAVQFDSGSCIQAFGYDTPSEQGIDEAIMETLKKDGFFTEE